MIRPEATGFGIVYFGREMLKTFGDTFEGKTVVISGYGNVAWGAAMKLTELGAKVVTISGSQGYVYDENGVNTPEKFEFMRAMRAKGLTLKDYADKFGATFFKGEKPWGVKGDIVIPAATQNEISIDDAKKNVANGTNYLVEASNMPSTNDSSC